MPTNPLSRELADLLRVLEKVEQGTTDDRLGSALRQLAHWHEEALPEKPSPADRNVNPMVDRIATAMKLAGYA